MKLALAGAALCLFTALPARAGWLETEPRTFPIGPQQRVRIEFPVGELKVSPGDETRVRFALRVRCTGRDEARCAEQANRLVLDSKVEGNTLHLTLHKASEWTTHGMKVTAEVQVPRALSTQIEMGVGDLRVAGLEGELDVSLGVGDAEIRTRRAGAGEASVETGIGDATIRGAGIDAKRHGFIGSRTTWSGGGGRKAVRLHVGVGDANVVLE